MSTNVIGYDFNETLKHSLQNMYLKITGKRFFIYWISRFVTIGHVNGK